MIYLIGIGLEGPSALSPRALAALRRSRFIAGGRRHLEGLDSLEGIAGERFPITSDLAALEKAIRDFMGKNRGGNVSVLATGDPLLYGIGDFILRTFGRRSVRVIPGVSVVQEAFSRIRESEAGLKVMSLHGRKADFAALSGVIATNPCTALFTDRVNTPDRIARGLMDAGLGGVRAHVIEALGLEGERVFSGGLKAVSGERFDHPLSVMVFISGARTRDKGAKSLEKGSGTPDKVARTPLAGIGDALFRHSGNMITKSEIRAVSLSKLAPPPSGVVWDIGSCTGSVAIEAGRLAPSGRVFAIEKNRKRVRDIRENIRAFNASNVQVVEGEAPACLKDLPAPDAVFIGGGGAGILKILGHAVKRTRSGGAIVVNAVTMETATRAMGFFRERGMERELVQMGLARGKEAGGLTILSASNPVFIVKGVKG